MAKIGEGPRWYAACNGVARYSHNGYFCDGGSISENDEMKHCWKNRNRILLMIEGLRQNGEERVSVKRICIETNLTEEFVTFVLKDEFDDELEEE